jgi:hypothetical protein
LAVLRHIVLLQWKPDASDADKQAVRVELASLPAAIPEIRHYAFGDDAGLADGNFDFAIIAEFDSRPEWQTYVTHAEHQRVIAERIRPILQNRVAVQYES